jgi:hypothetical protein
VYWFSESISLLFTSWVSRGIKDCSLQIKLLSLFQSMCWIRFQVSLFQGIPSILSTPYRSKQFRSSVLTCYVVQSLGGISSSYEVCSQLMTKLPCGSYRILYPSIKLNQWVTCFVGNHCFFHLGLLFEVSRFLLWPYFAAFSIVRFKLTFILPLIRVN